MEENLNTAPIYQESDELEIDWMGIFTKLLKHWKQIVLIGFIFGCLGIASALMMKRQYSVQMTLAPELQNRNTSSLSSLTNMLGLGGMNMGISTDAMNITLFPEICSSTPFLAALLDVPLTSYVSEKQAEKGVKPYATTVYKHLSGEDKPNFKPKKDYKPYTGVKDPTELTPGVAKVVKKLSMCIGAEVDKKTGVTTISVSLDDPLMTKQLADTVCTRLQEYVSDYRTKKATSDYNYYVLLANEAHEELVKAQAAYARSVDYDRSVILQSANSEK